MDSVKTRIENAGALIFPHDCLQGKGLAEKLAPFPSLAAPLICLPLLSSVLPNGA
jgi:hypothetical protein